MNCLVCHTDNKETAKACRKCGIELNLEPLWKPTWKWHAKVLSIIYVCLIGVYFAISNLMNRLPEPYRIRQVPPEVTPWLQK